MANNHALKLGEVIGNLQSLEMMLRFWLARREGATAVAITYDLKVGDVVEENAFTNYDSLGELVDKFNAAMAADGHSFRIDRSRIVDLRDLQAHGRVSADKPDAAALRIIKFSRPKDGEVTVVATVLMDDVWFKAHLAHLRKALEDVSRFVT